MNKSEQKYEGGEVDQESHETGRRLIDTAPVAISQTHETIENNSPIRRVSSSKYPSQIIL